MRNPLMKCGHKANAHTHKDHKPCCAKCWPDVKSMERETIHKNYENKDGEKEIKSNNK